MKILQINSVCGYYIAERIELDIYHYFDSKKVIGTVIEKENYEVLKRVIGHEELL